MEFIAFFLDQSIVDIFSLSWSGFNVLRRISLDENIRS